tara:strand:+ start:548 stop:904 length:357 start_codon:yes stop_codon:yes gene_type:complete
LIIHIILIIFTIIIIEVLILIELVDRLKNLKKNIIKIPIILISKKKSDAWKETSIKKYSFKLLINSLVILISIFFILLGIFMINFIKDDFFNYIIGFKGFLEIAFIALIYLFVRKKIQ